MKHKLVRVAIGVPTALMCCRLWRVERSCLLGTYKEGVLVEAGGL